MSRLKDILVSLNEGEITSYETAEQQIKVLLLELCEEMEVPSGYTDEKEVWQAMGYNRAVREIRQEIEDLA